MNKKILLVIAVIASAAVTARANLVTNPGFETGDFSGWTQFGDTSFTAVDTRSPGGFPPHSGNYLAYFGPLSPGGITQSIATTPGTTYYIDFWLSADGSGDSDFASASFGGVTFFMLPGSGTFDWTHETGIVIATSSSSALTFTFVNVPSYWNLDDVSVLAVPEPGILGLIASGALGLVATLRSGKFSSGHG